MGKTYLRLIKRNDNHYLVALDYDYGYLELCDIYEHDLGCFGFAKVNGYATKGIYLLKANYNNQNPKLEYQIELEDNKPYKLKFDFNKIYKTLGKANIKTINFDKWAKPLFVE